MFYKASFYDRDAHMNLERRYEVHDEYIDDESSIREIYFGNKKEKLFIAGRVDMEHNLTTEQVRAKYDEDEKLCQLARQFGDENYPDWRDIHAYWDDDKEKEHKHH